MRGQARVAGGGGGCCNSGLRLRETKKLRYRPRSKRGSLHRSVANQDERGRSASSNGLHNNQIVIGSFVHRRADIHDARVISVECNFREPLPVDYEGHTPQPWRAVDDTNVMFSAAQFPEGMSLRTLLDRGRIVDRIAAGRRPRHAAYGKC